MDTAYIITAGGIGNRFGGLINGLILSKLLNKKPKIIWEPCNHCGAKFYDLFDCDIEDVEYLDFNRVQFFENNKTFNIMCHDLVMPGVQYLNPYNFDNLNNLIFNIPKDQNIFVNLPIILDYFKSLIPEALKELKFKQKFQDKANSIIKENVNGIFYGIHRRKTDFYDIVDDLQYLSLIKENPDKKYFICSDDERTEKLYLENPNVFSQVKTKYTEKKNLKLGWNQTIDLNGNVITDYNIYNVLIDKETSESSLVDLLILSKSIIITTNQNSSFLQTAINLSKK